MAMRAGVIGVRLNIPLVLSHEEYHFLWNEAARQGFIRDEPSKAWTVTEQRQAIRWLVLRNTYEILRK